MLINTNWCDAWTSDLIYLTEKSGGSNGQTAPGLVVTALTASETLETWGSLIISTLHLTDSSSCPTSTAANYGSVSEPTSSGS